MEVPDEELRRRLREAETVSRKRSTPLPRANHVAESTGFFLVEAGLGLARRALYWFGVVAIVVVVVVTLATRP